MKKFFYFAFAAVVALANVACGDDDDDNGGSKNKPVTITKASMADNAFLAEFDEDMPIKGNLGDIENPVSKHVKSIGVLDGGQIDVTIEDDETGETEVVVADVEDVEDTEKGTKFKVNSDKFKGFVEVMNEVATSRGVATGEININFTINGVTYSTNGTPVQCLMQAALATNGGVLTYVCQKFLVTKMAIELEGDVVQPYKVFNHGRLIEIYNIANKNGANLTDEDKKGFDKVIKYVSVSQFGELNIIYDDGTSDGGNWDWAKGQTDQMVLWL